MARKIKPFRVIGAIAAFMLLVLVCVVSSWGADGAFEDENGFVRCDPTKVMGADACAKCHEAAVNVWRTTPHFATFDSLHRKPEAKAIADKLGLRSVKRNDVCTKCHYTCQEVDGRQRVVAGVSCESCHGAARDWIDKHSDYGGPNITKEMESAAHRDERIKTSVALGMNNPANLYSIARQCLACHTSPDEKLVNVGGHAAGTAEFELVGWSQGMIHHNLLASGGTMITPSTPERLRVMYVVGVMADLEASLRATAAATEKATYGVTAARRAAELKKRLYAISELVDNPQVDAAMQAALAVKLKLHNGEALVGAADAIGQAAYEFAATTDGTSLAALDPLLPPPESWKWQAGEE
ncbi:MAG: cytochrome c family protein [Planctomycetales bacterium]|nr:cytochrome c family protein [Planctomycetales bacterium]